MEKQNINSKGEDLLIDSEDGAQADRKNTIIEKIKHSTSRGSAVHLFLILTFGIFAGETLVELLINTLSPFSQLSKVLLDSTLLLILAFPILYFFVFRPMMVHTHEHKGNEEMLRESEKRYMKAQEIGQVGNWEYDIKNGAFWGSDEGKRLYGFNLDTDIFTAEEVMKCVIDKDRVHQALLDLIEKNEPYNIVFDIIPLNCSEKRTINSIAKLVRDENGNPIKVTGVMLDITERKYSEEKLNYSLSLMDGILESIHNGILVVNDQGTVIKANAKFAEMWRIPDDILASGNDKILLDSVFGQLVDPDGFIAKVNELYGKPEAESLEEIALKDGRLFNRISKPLYLGREPKGRVWSFLDITERKLAEGKILDDRLLLRTLIDNIPDSIYCKDLACRKTLTNLTELRFIGVKSEAEVLGKDDFDFYPKELAEKFFADDQSVMQTGKPVLNREEYILDENKQKRWLLTSKLPLRDKDGRIIGLVGIGRDITGRRQAEEAFRQSEARYKELSMQLEAILDHIPGLVFYKDKKNNFIRVNKYLALAHGKEKEELEGKNLSDFYPEEDATKYQQDDLEVINSGIAKLNIEEPWQTAEGLKWVSTSKIPFAGDNGEYIGIIGMSIDVTERKHAEETISNERLLLRTLIDNIPDSIYCKDLACRKTITNLTELRFIGVKSEAEVLGKDDFDFYPKELADKFFADDQSVIQSGMPVLNREEYILDENKQKRWLLTSKLPLRDKDSRIIGLVGIGRDITERKQAEEEINLKNEELLKINSEKDKFFSIIAHDLRGPFNGFLGLTQIMADESSSLSTEEFQQMAASMEKSASNLFRLLENLLHWARVQQGLIPFNPIVVELLPLVEESIAIVLEQAKSKGVEIARGIPNNLMVFADNNMLQTIIRNLVSNAVKFTTKGGKVTLSAKPAGDNFVIIAIKDTGIGMRQEIVEKLFRLDVQTGREGTEGEPSTGLGLLLCKEFVEKHGGKIWVESEVGQGSTFHFTIPLNAPA